MKYDTTVWQHLNHSRCVNFKLICVPALRAMLMDRQSHGYDIYKFPPILSRQWWSLI